MQVIELTARGRELRAARTRATANVGAAFHANPSPAGRLALDAPLLDLDTRHPVVIAES